MLDREPRLVAIVPCNGLDAAEGWWNRLGFHRPPGQDYPGYRMLADEEGSEVHLNQTPEGWVVPHHNPFGVYLYTRRVGQIAAEMRDYIIERGKAPEHKPWGMYECALHGSDGLLVRMGWPSEQMGA